MPDDLIGIKVANYEIVRKLGSGSSSTSFLAADSKGKQAVAKKLNPDLDSAPATRERFLAASDLSSKVRMKQRLAVVIGQKCFDRGTLLLRQYVEGESLAARMQAGTVGELDITRIGMDLCDAVRALSSQGVVHGGIHPGNVIIQADGRARLTDFATSGPYLNLSADSQFPLEVLSFLAPEQWDQKEPTVQSDIYSTGLIILMLDRGRKVFNVSDINSLQSEIKAGIKVDCPIMSAALSLDPARRYPKIDTFRAKLPERKTQAAEDAPATSSATSESANETESSKIVDPPPIPVDDGTAKPSRQTTQTTTRSDAGRTPEKSTDPTREVSPPPVTETPPLPPKKPVGSIAAVFDLVGQVNLIEKQPPPIWKIPQSDQPVDRPLAISNSGTGPINVEVSCFGDGFAISPPQIRLLAYQKGNAKLKLQPGSSQFGNIVFKWQDNKTTKMIVIRISR